MPASLLTSQLETLEHLGQDEDGIRIVNDCPLGEVVDRILTGLGPAQSLR